MGCDYRGGKGSDHKYDRYAGRDNSDFGFFKAVPDIAIEKAIQGVFNSDSNSHVL
jgi:hypothetical protein